MSEIKRGNIVQNLNVCDLTAQSIRAKMLELMDGSKSDEHVYPTTPAVDMAIIVSENLLNTLNEIDDLVLA